VLAALVAAQSRPSGYADTSFLQTPRALPELGLQDARTGASFSNQHFLGQWTLLYSGYLNCPDLCPTTTALLAALNQQLTPQFVARGQQPPRFALLSIDHFRDTAESIASYTRAFDDAIIPLTGSREALKVTTSALGFISPPSTARSKVAHSSAIALIGPDAKLRALFRYPHSMAKLKAVLLSLPGRATQSWKPQDAA